SITESQYHRITASQYHNKNGIQYSVFGFDGCITESQYHSITESHTYLKKHQTCYLTQNNITVSFEK
ncbi:MAG: hypothetical protein PHP52_08475, partial [Bacteroidales bacterium]|nr:hypothetical protein [Bacteroidales bacterium]